MRFVIFVVDQKSRSASTDEMAAIDAFNEKLRANGNWVMAFGLEKPQPGSIQDSDDYYSGMWVIEADGQEQAQALANEGGIACNRRVELRPFL